MNYLLIIPDLDSGSGKCSIAIADELQKREERVILLTRFWDKEMKYPVISYYKKNVRKIDFG